MEQQTDFIENYPAYKPTKGEEYMGPDMLAHFREKLNAWKAQLIEEANSTVTHLQSDSETPADPSDRASQEEEFALELRTRDRERKLISKIDKSLNLIETGEFGYCKMSGDEIGLPRMEARPTADLTVEMKRKQEIREKQGVA
ncbi:MAG: RNA polymerase-binding protein DksA [Gammaproteobacteria bacterium]|nr:RNA polymerase-binding protein DksA [Gammaproteobacteria bacterium]